MSFLQSMRYKHFITKIIWTVLVLSVSLYANKDTFTWYDDDDYKPYIYKSKEGQAKGVFKDIMEEIFRRLEIPLTCKLFPWNRTQVFVKNGLADGMVTVATKKRLETMVHTQPLISSGEKIFTKRDNPKIEEIKKIASIEELKEYRIVDVVGAGWAEEHFRDFPHMIWAPKLSSALYMLANGRVDIYVMNEFSGIEIIKSMLKTNSPFQENLKKIVICPHTLETINYSLLINKKSKWANLVPRINRILDEMKHDGTYDKIIGRYLSIDLK